MKVQNRAAGQVLTIPVALSVISPYPASCGAVVPAVPAARYCRGNSNRPDRDGCSDDVVSYSKHNWQRKGFPYKANHLSIMVCK